MRYILSILSLTFIGMLTSFAQGNSAYKTESTNVSVLGYHDFSETRAVSDMLIRTSKFRKQMQKIKDKNLNVITLEDFILWKDGKKELPDRSILITIDDGWKSVYTDAYPILKEFGFPFAIYLYTDYLDRGGRSMTTEMVKEMMENGCSIGSHSISHPKPSILKQKKSSGKDAYEQFLHQEFGQSQKLLKEKFGGAINTYVYPGGYFEPGMFPIIDEYGYKYLFTCLPGKTTRNSKDKEIPRYIVLGPDEYDFIFKRAITFETSAVQHPVSPKPGEQITSRTPNIVASLSAIDDLDSDSLKMRIAGFGQVPAEYHPERKEFSWTINRPLRFDKCTVYVYWKKKGNTKYEAPIKWTFTINKQAAYLPQTNS